MLQVNGSSVVLCCNHGICSPKEYTLGNSLFKKFTQCQDVERLTHYNTDQV